jgi:hypothetical protein
MDNVLAALLRVFVVGVEFAAGFVYFCVALVHVGPTVHLAHHRPK